MKFNFLFIFLAGVFLLFSFTTSSTKIDKEHLKDLPAHTQISQQLFTAFLNKYPTFQSKMKKEIVTFIDFTRPSTEKRLWVVDLQRKKVLIHCHVAHGKNTGVNTAEKFSNRPNSYQSSLGFYCTGKTYTGKHGYSLRLIGLEKGINDKAYERAIVIHPADYASTTFIEKHGRLGRSFGCPALPPDVSKKVIDLIKDESLLFIYHKSYNS